MEKDLKITEEAVLAAAEECPDAKDVLSKLFPIVFKKEVDFKMGFADAVIRGLVQYSGFEADDCDKDEWMPRERYIMSRIFLSGIRSDVVDEIERLGPRKFYAKYQYLPERQ